MTKFRVVDLRSGVIEPEHIVEASSPELAALQVLGEKGCEAGRTVAGYFVGFTGRIALAKPTW
ncbi:hypothetical protein [Devosia riboflavina]